jgi:hypothetical protein
MMKQLWLTLVGAALLALGGASTATAVEIFDFDAQVVTPVAVGDELSLHGRIVNGNQVPAPISLDFATFEYTVVITGLRLDVDGTVQQYSGGTVAIYEDAATAASYGAPETFSDGVAILTGTVTTLDRILFTSALGSANGSVDWTGGSRFGELAPAATTGWALLSSISRSPSLVEAGFDEQWDGKVEPHGDVVKADPGSWGAVKARF